MTSPELLGALSEINQLREQVVRLGRESVALNHLCYSLAVALGDTDDGKTVEVVPLDLVRRIVVRAEAAEAKLVEVRAALPTLCRCDECYGDMPELCVYRDIKKALND